MLQIAIRRDTTFVVLVAVLCLAGCTREVSQPERVDPIAPAPLPPGGEGASASPIFGWACDDGARVVTRYDGATGVLELAGADEVERLASTRGDSGARWAGEGVAFHVGFRNEGDEARLTRGSAVTRCEIDPVATADARAAADGVRLRGLGREGDWSLEIRADRMLWIGAWGAERRRFLDPVRSPGDPPRWYGQDEVGAITVSVTGTECRDSSGRGFPVSVSVEFDGRRVDGCGRWLDAIF